MGNITLSENIIRSKDIDNLTKALYIYIAGVRTGYTNLKIFMDIHNIKNNKKNKDDVINAMNNIIKLDIAFIEIANVDIDEIFYVDLYMHNINNGNYSLLDYNIYKSILEIRKDVIDLLIVYAVLSTRFIKNKDKITSPNFENSAELSDAIGLSRKTIYTKINKLVTSSILTKITIYNEDGKKKSMYFNALDIKSILFKIKECLDNNIRIIQINNKEQLANIAEGIIDIKDGFDNFNKKWSVV